MNRGQRSSGRFRWFARRDRDEWQAQPEPHEREQGFQHSARGARPVQVACECDHKHRGSHHGPKQCIEGMHLGSDPRGHGDRSDRAPAIRFHGVVNTGGQGQHTEPGVSDLVGVQQQVLGDVADDHCRGCTPRKCPALEHDPS